MVANQKVLVAVEVDPGQGVSAGLMNGFRVVVRQQGDGNFADEEDEEDEETEIARQAAMAGPLSESELRRLQHGRLFRLHGNGYPAERFICVIGGAGKFQLMWTEEGAGGERLTGFLQLSKSVKILTTSAAFSSSKWIGRGTDESALFSIVCDEARFDLEAEDEPTGVNWARWLRRLVSHALSDAESLAMPRTHLMSSPRRMLPFDGAARPTAPFPAFPPTAEWAASTASAIVAAEWERQNPAAPSAAAAGGPFPTPSASPAVLEDGELSGIYLEIGKQVGGEVHVEYNRRDRVLTIARASEGRKGEYAPCFRAPSLQWHDPGGPHSHLQ
jgi:hypothetical protein